MSTKFIFDQELCLQCGSCTAACDVLHQTEKGVHFREVLTSWTENSPDGKPQMSVAMKGCMHCENAACEAVCPVGAISTCNDGGVRVNSEECVGCGACVKVCPFDAPVICSTGKMEKCNLCGSPVCVWNCPGGALRIRA